MVGRKQIHLKNHLNEKELRKEVKKYKKCMRIYERLHFIEMLQKGMPIDEAADLSHISLPTAYSWLELYNEGGLEGLKPNFGGGRPSKLNKDQQIELKNILIEKIDSGEKLNRNDVVKLIKDVFNVKYSSKQVGEILDKLGFGYSKALSLSTLNKQTMLRNI